MNKEPIEISGPLEEFKLSTATSVTLANTTPKSVEIDFDKIKTVDDIVLLFKAYHNRYGEGVRLFIKESDSEPIKHLIKEEDNG